MPPTVLLVDDDLSVLKFATRSLERAGLRVFAFSDPREAHRFFEAAPSQIDVLATDIIMPGLDGFDLACALFARRPGLSVVFLSGFYPEGVARTLPFPFRLLAKPFTAASLRETIFAALPPSATGA